MKFQSAIILFSLALAVAVGVYVFQAPASPEAASSPDSTSELTPLAKDDELKDSPDQDQVPVAPEPHREPAASPTEAASDTMPPEELKQTIKSKLAGARELMQKKVAIENARPEDLHDTPRETVDAARRLGEIAELEARHPEQAASFRDFYLECARDDSTITVTRAQCLDKYMRVSKMDAVAQKQFLREFPEEIVRLVEALQ